MSAPTQPDIPDPSNATASNQRRALIQGHRTDVLEYARAHEGEWVTYWTSPSKATARGVKRRIKKYLIGEYDVMTKDYAHHGHWSDEGWSIRLNGLSAEVRYNGPWSPGLSPVPEWRSGPGYDTIPEQDG